jgi:hypothetical protein
LQPTAEIGVLPVSFSGQAPFFGVKRANLADDGAAKNAPVTWVGIGDV